MGISWVPSPDPLQLSVYHHLPLIKKPKKFLPTANNTWKICCGKRTFAAWRVSSLSAQIQKTSLVHIGCLLPPRHYLTVQPHTHPPPPRGPTLPTGSAEPPWKKGLCFLHQDLAWTRIGKGNLFV